VKELEMPEAHASFWPIVRVRGDFVLATEGGGGGKKKGRRMRNKGKEDQVGETREARGELNTI
jgi:hypothetical protein